MYFSDNQAKTITACLGRSDSHAVFTRHCSVGVHLFQSLQNSLNGKKSVLWKTKRHPEQFFAQKDKKLWEDGIMNLPEK